MKKLLKKTNKAEETERKEKMEAEQEQEADELGEEELDEANGGLLYVAAFLAGAYAGDVIRKAWNKKK